MEYKTLANGIKVPMLGFGVYQIPQEQTKQAVLDALKIGYRKIDTAQSYFNEEQVGDALAATDVKREDIFVTTKVWIEHYGEGPTYASVLDSMKKLKVDYIDLVLLHQPFSDYYGAYRDLEKLYKEGKVHAIGVSNFYPDRLVDLASFSKIPPMVNQIEVNPFNQQIEAQEWNEKYQVAVEAWAPFGEGRNGTFTNPTLVNIGKKYSKTAAQVILRWLIQRGIIVNAKSVHAERMQQNYDVFDFRLSDEDMKEIAALDQKKSSFFSHQDPKMVEWFVKMVEERKSKHVAAKEKKSW